MLAIYLIFGGLLIFCYVLWVISFIECDMGQRWGELMVCRHWLLDLAIIGSSIVFLVFVVIDPGLCVVSKVIWVIVMAVSVCIGIWLFYYWMMIMSA